MALTLAEVSNISFPTTRAADEACEKLLRGLGYKVRYLPARLAIARSLALSGPPPTVDSESDDLCRPIRGEQLFGHGPEMAAWLSLLVQRMQRPELTRKDLIQFVAAHWNRGATLVLEDWEAARGDLATFIKGLCDTAGYSAAPRRSRPTPGDLVGISGQFRLAVGETAEDVDTGEQVVFPLNSPGGSPHMAIMGAAGSGKTRTAVAMIQRLHSQAPVPLLAFDFKGDLAEDYGLAALFGATVIEPPRQTLPLDVLAVEANDDYTIKQSAQRFRDSFAQIKKGGLGGNQMGTLREVAERVLRAKKSVTLNDIRAAVEAEYQRQGQRPDAMVTLLKELTAYNLFTPTFRPAEFFSKSWIVKLPPSTPPELRRLVVNLLLDSLDGWLNSQRDSAVEGGHRALRHFCLVDEAHQILGNKLPSLNNLIRMSRSKGGVVMLISQSPNDFEGEDDDFTDNVGLTVAFNTQADAGPSKRIFGISTPLSSLGTGEALVRIRTEAKTRRVRCWTPQ